MNKKREQEGRGRTRGENKRRKQEWRTLLLPRLKVGEFVCALARIWGVGGSG